MDCSGRSRRGRRRSRAAHCRAGRTLRHQGEPGGKLIACDARERGDIGFRGEHDLHHRRGPRPHGRIRRRARPPSGSHGRGAGQARPFTLAGPRWRQIVVANYRTNNVSIGRSAPALAHDRTREVARPFPYPAGWASGRPRDGNHFGPDATRWFQAGRASTPPLRRAGRWDHRPALGASSHCDRRRQRPYGLTLVEGMRTENTASAPVLEAIA